MEQAPTQIPVLGGCAPHTDIDHRSVVFVFTDFDQRRGVFQHQRVSLDDLVQARDGRIQIIGINYKDKADNARRFLGRYGNPFSHVGMDANGRAAIEWGVYGVPETFIVGRDSKIAYKLIGAITPENIDKVLKVEIEKALKAGS